MKINFKDNWKKYFRILILAGLLILFYFAGMALYLIVAIGLILIFLLILKGKIYKNVEKFIENKFRFFSKIHPIWKKIFVILIFIVIYFIAREIVFSVMKVFGFDMQRVMIESINKSVLGN